jgi:hypothetical protein
MPEDIFFKVLKISFAFLPAVGGIGIFIFLFVKNRRLKILVANNRKGIRPDTFERLRETPCGWLVASLALHDLRKCEEHRSFSRKDWKDIRLTVLGLKRRKVHA